MRRAHSGPPGAPVGPIRVEYHGARSDPVQCRAITIPHSPPPPVSRRTRSHGHPRRSGHRQRPRRIDQPAAGQASPVPRARHDVRDPDRDHGPDGLRAGLGVRCLARRADARPAGAGRHPRLADGLAVAPGPGASRAPRGRPPDPRGRLRPGPLRGAARHADRARQPPRVPGGDGAPVGRGGPPQPAAGPRHRRPRRLQADQRRPRPRGRRRPAARHAATTMAGYLRRSDRAFRIGGDEFAIIMPGTDADAGQLAVRRVLAGCLDGEGDDRDARRRLVLGRHQRHPGPGPRPRLALSPGRRRAVLEQAPRPDVRDHLRRRSATTDSLAVAAAGRAVGARRAGRGDRRVARGLPADLRPDDGVRRAGSRVSSGRCPTAASPIPPRCSRRPRRPAGRRSSTSPA